MKRIVLFSVILLVAAVLAGCSGGIDAAGAAPAGAAPVVSTEAAEATEAPAPQAPPPAAASGADLGETLVDEQGAIAVSVKPLNIGQEAGTLDFEVAMNTHSVDLSMDLATLATLTADTGAQVAASSWDAPMGGHHANGVLSFPAATAAGSLLEGATTLTLTLVDLDAPERTFTWSLQ